MKTVEELIKSVHFCKNEQNTTKSDHLHNIEIIKEEIKVITCTPNGPRHSAI